MVHVRLNERETNPNPNINFISALPCHDPTEQDSAKQLLRALAAQVRPLMKSHGFSVNSLEEYEYNSVFAGRNWNAGETVELVLRRADRTFLPIFWLLSTFCHELAHIKHMNHGPAFQALWKTLNAEVRSLQNKGYFGDGYWSSGTRLADSSKVAAEDTGVGDLPEYMCGGAHNRARPSSVRRRRSGKPQNNTMASNNTGRQTGKRRKAGARVTSKNAFVGKGMALAEGVEEGKGKAKGTGFGKQAASKRAREERALAAEKRIGALQTQPGASTSNATSDGESGSDSDEGEEISIHETDSQRRQTLLSSEQNDDLQGLKSGNLWDFFQQDFISGSQGTSHVNETDHHDAGYSGTSTAGSSSSQRKRKHAYEDNEERPRPRKMVGDPATPLGIGKLVQSEIDLRTKESLGMAPVKGRGQTLGTGNSIIAASSHNTAEGLRKLAPSPVQWTCLVCTLRNDEGHLACSACATPRDDKIWAQRS